MRKSLLLLLALPALMLAQPAGGNLRFVGTAPAGACANSAALEWVVSSGPEYGCVAGTWTIISTSGGGGSVTSFSSGSLSPLFTTSVNTPTTTPALSFALSNAAANTIFGGPTSGGPSAPSFQTAPTISAANMTNFPTFNQNTTGTAANVTGIVAEANGGTGANNTAGAAGHGLRSNGTHYVDGQFACGDLSNSSGGCAMSTTAGGDLSGTLPSPTVAKVNGSTPGNTCTNQFTRSINSSAVGTCASVSPSDDAAQAADTVIMNATGSSASPTAVAMPTCTTGAVLYNTTTHAWSCVSTGGGGPNVTAGSYASLPGTCTHTATQSDIYYLQGSLYQFALCSATNTWTFYRNGNNVTLPPSASWTWDNQGSSTVDYSTNGYGYMVTATATDQIRVQYRTAPSTPYSIRALFHCDWGSILTGTLGTRRSGAWFVFSDSSAKYLNFGFWSDPADSDGAVIQLVGQNNSATSLFTSTPVNNRATRISFTSFTSDGDVLIKALDDGTNITFYDSLDKGAHWIQVYQASRTAYFSSGPTRIGWATMTDPTVANYCTLLDWTQGTS